MDKYVVIVSALTGSVDKCLRIVEGTDMIPIQIRIKDFNMPEGASALVYAKARGMAARVQTATINGNAVEFTPNKGFFVQGENVMQGRITKDGKDLITFAISVICTKSIVTDDADEINSDPTLLQQLLREIGVISARTSTLASLKEGSTTGDAELIDARVDKNGNVHDNVGEHIREVTSQLSEDVNTQVTELKGDISKLGDFVEPINIYNKNFSETESIDGKTIEYSNGYASNYAIQGSGENKGAIIDYDGRYISYPIPVHGGKTLYFYWGSGIVAYNMFFVNCYDKNMQFIERNPHSGVTSYELPKDTAYVRLMIQSDDWFTNGYQMITYSNIENTTYHRFFESFYLENDICDVLKLGAKGDGETDDSDIIQSALDVFPVVYLPPTEKGYMISKPLVISKHSQKFYGGNHMPYYSSDNHSRKCSTIRPLPTFVGIAMIIVDHFAYGAELSNFALTWNSDAPDIATDGIDVGYAPDINSVSSLGFNVLRDIFIYRLNGNGIVAHYKNWDNHFHNVHVKKCSQNGFKLDCTDSVFIGCNASDNRKNGYEVNKGACVFDSCKAFCNGTIGDTDTAGFVINGQHTRLNGCNSQQNYTNGIIINSKTNAISGMVIDGNGWNNPTDYLTALKINKSGNILSSVVIIPHWLAGCVKYGIDIADGVKNIDLVASITEAYDDWTIVKDTEGNLVYAGFEEFVQVSPNTKFGGNRVIINCVQQID